MLLLALWYQLSVHMLHLSTARQRSTTAAPQRIIYQELLAVHSTQECRPRPTMADAEQMWQAADLLERNRLIREAAINGIRDQR